MVGHWLVAPEIPVDLSAPPGARYGAASASFWDAGGRLARTLRATLPLTREHLVQMRAFPLVEEFRPEADAIAERLGIDPDEVLAANMSYDLALSEILCSVVAVAGPEGPALARNLDWWPPREIARASCLLRFERRGEAAFWIAGWPGSIGAISGMSARGFALALNAAFSDERAPNGASPVTLMLRCVLQGASCYDEALERICAEPLAAAAIVTLIGRENDQRVVIERTPTRCAVRRAHGDEPLVATNCCLRLPGPQARGRRNELLRTARRRHTALTQRMGAARVAPWNEEDLLAALSHPDVRLPITAQQMVFRPGAGRARLVRPAALLLRRVSTAAPRAHSRDAPGARAH